ncbi:MAG TPA: acyltransferase, partial [Candidatus Dormibacteraeota bacterium]|nr:acyltransferase [Candidatus Dormibacteraeota bacterium]
GLAPPSWRHFYLRRFWKIAPSYLLSIAVAYGIGYAARQGGAGAGIDLLTHLLFIHTWFPQSAGAINGVLWTLAVEVEFYALFPLLWWCFRRSRRLTALGMIAAAMLWRLYAVACCTHTSIVVLDQDLPAYLDCFAFGMLAASLFVELHRHWSERRRFTFGVSSFAIGIILCTGLLESLYGFRNTNQWAAVWAAPHRELLALGFALVALGALLSPRPVQRILANPLLIFFGAISYSLYLYHQIVARELLWHHLPAYSGTPQFDASWQVGYTILAALISIAIATLLTYCFERPIQRWGNR